MACGFRKDMVSCWRRQSQATGEKGGWPHCIMIRKQKSLILLLISFCIFYSVSLGPRPVERCHQHSHWFFLPQLNSSGNILIDTPRSFISLIIINGIKLKNKITHHSILIDFPQFILYSNKTHMI